MTIKAIPMVITEIESPGTPKPAISMTAPTSMRAAAIQFTVCFIMSDTSSGELDDVPPMLRLAAVGGQRHSPPHR